MFFCNIEIYTVIIVDLSIFTNDLLTIGELHFYFTEINLFDIIMSDYIKGKRQL